MKKISSVLLAAAFGMLAFSSCGKEEPENVNLPDINGSWTISENSQDYGPSTYTITIADSSNASHKQLAYLYGFSTKLYGSVNGNTLTIPLQLVEGNNVSGSGTQTNANRIELDYWVQSSLSHTDTVRAVLIR